MYIIYNYWGTQFWPIPKCLERPDCDVTEMTVHKYYLQMAWLQVSELTWIAQKYDSLVDSSIDSW